MTTAWPRSSWTTRRSTRSPSRAGSSWPRRSRRSATIRAVRVVVLRAEGRGFNAGVDIKEMQSTEGFDALIGANRGCFAAFAAVYDCKVPGDRRRARLSASAVVSASSAMRTSSSRPTTRPSVCPRSIVARSAPRPIWPGSSRSTRCGPWCTPRRRRRPQELAPLRLGAAVSSRRTSCATPRSRSHAPSRPSRRR